MQITDAQVHIWSADTPERPWLPSGHSYAHGAAFGSDQLLAAMEGAGVNRTVLVPPSWEGDYNDVCLAAVQEHPGRFGVMGRIKLTDPDNRDQIPEWRSQPGMLGIRVTLSRPPAPSWLHDGTCEWLWPAAEGARVPIMIYAPGNLDAVRDIARRHPGLPLTVDHIGAHISNRDDELDPVLDQLISLAALPNVSVKATSLPNFVSDEYPFLSLHPRIARIIEAFGPQRVFWGSDLTRLVGSYREAVTLFTEELDFLSPGDLELVMGRGLEKWLRWDEAATR